jgi:hypothetical protein
MQPANWVGIVGKSLNLVQISLKMRGKGAEAAQYIGEEIVWRMI